MLGRWSALPAPALAWYSDFYVRADSRHGLEAILVSCQVLNEAGPSAQALATVGAEEGVSQFPPAVQAMAES